MGCYDTVIIKCPKCGADYYTQSKSGPCEFVCSSLEDTPLCILEDVNRHAPFHCDCGVIFEVDLKLMKTVECEDRPPIDHLGVKEIIDKIKKENPIPTDDEHFEIE